MSSHLNAKNGEFTETGSGRTYKETLKRGRFLQGGLQQQLFFGADPEQLTSWFEHGFPKTAPVRRETRTFFFWRHFLHETRSLTKTGSGQNKTQRNTQ